MRDKHNLIPQIYTCLLYKITEEENKHLCPLPEGLLQQNLCEGPWPDFVTDEALHGFLAIGRVEDQQNEEVYNFMVWRLLHWVYCLSCTIIDFIYPVNLDSSSIALHVHVVLFVSYMSNFK